MSNPPALFDRAQLLRQRHRAVRSGPEMFLHELAVCEVEERLIDVNRTFRSVGIVSGFPAFWSRAFPGAVVVPDDDILDLEVGAFDLVIHGMCLHWANDPVGQLVQCRRALRNDGFLLAAFFGGQTLHELRAALAEAEALVSGGLSPRIAPMGEIRDLGALLQRAGLALPVADSVKQTVKYRSLGALIQDLRAMGESNALAQRQKQMASKHLVEQTQRIYQESFADTDGLLQATYELIFLSGWAPDASQQQPLKPGSAQTRLADFLETTERDPQQDPDASSVKGERP